MTKPKFTKAEQRIIEFLTKNEGRWFNQFEIKSSRQVLNGLVRRKVIKMQHVPELSSLKFPELNRLYSIGELKNDTANGDN